MVSQAILQKDHPVADTLFGVDNTFLTRALDAGIFDPYASPALTTVPADLRDGRFAAPSDADRYRQRVRRRRSLVLRSQRSSARAENARRSHQARVQEAARRRERGHVVARPRILAGDSRGEGDERLAGLLAQRCGRTACGSSTTGRRPTTLISPRAAGTATDRSSCRTARTRPPTSSTRSRIATRPTSECSTRRASIKPNTPACCTARTTPRRTRSRRLLLVARVPAGHAVADVREPGRHRRLSFPPVFARWAVVPTHPYTMDPATIAANRAAWIKEWTDIVVQ